MDPRMRGDDHEGVVCASPTQSLIKSLKENNK